MRKTTRMTAILFLTFLFMMPAVLASAQSPVNATGQQEKKEQKVIVLIKKDGKQIEADTTFITGTYTFTVGDTLQNDVQRKVVRLGDQKKLIIMQESESDTFNSPSAAPGAHAIRVEGYRIRDPFAFDPADPGIVSYKKKDIGKGQEKITIIRKKVETPK